MSQSYFLALTSDFNRSKAFFSKGFTRFEVANYQIFREKVPKFPPDHSQNQYFLIDKRSKRQTQQGF
jgi:hypothetical protein